MQTGQNITTLRLFLTLGSFLFCFINLFSQQRTPDYFIKKLGGDTVWCIIMNVTETKINYLYKNTDWDEEISKLTTYKWNSQNDAETKIAIGKILANPDSARSSNHNIERQKYPDYIVKKGNRDTIWCKILNETGRYIAYVQNTFHFSVKKTEVIAFKKGANVNAKDVNVITNPDTLESKDLITVEVDHELKTMKRPKVTLYETEEGMGKNSVIRLNWGHTLPYLKTDKEAMKHIKISRGFGVGKTIGFLGAVCGFAILGSSFISEDSEMGTTGGYILLPSLAVAIICNNIQRWQIRKAVKTYNRNAGYAYEDGLERKYRRK